MLFIIFLPLYFSERKDTKFPAHFSNEREKVYVNDSKGKKQKIDYVRKFDHLEKGRGIIYDIKRHSTMSLLCVMFKRINFSHKWQISAFTLSLNLQNIILS